MHRALADAETCARVLCALFPRLCANAATVAEARRLQGPRRRPPARKPSRRRASGRVARAAAAEPPPLDFGELPRDPGVYLFRDAPGRRSTSASRCRSRAARGRTSRPSAPPLSDAAGLARTPTVVDYRSHELRARRARAREPPDQGAARRRATCGSARRDDRLVYIRCRLDIPFPILEVAPEPGGRARGVDRAAARAAARRSSWSSSSTRCSGCATAGGKLPRARAPVGLRADGPLPVAVPGRPGPQPVPPPAGRGAGAVRGRRRRRRARCWRTSSARCARPPREQRYERAAGAAPARRAPAASSSRGLGGVLEATHARPRLLIDSHPTAPRRDALLGGRRPARRLGAGRRSRELRARTPAAAAPRRARRASSAPTCRPTRSTRCGSSASWLASHPDRASSSSAGAATPSAAWPRARTARSRVPSAAVGARA